MLISLQSVLVRIQLNGEWKGPVGIWHRECLVCLFPFIDKLIEMRINYTLRVTI